MFCNRCKKIFVSGNSNGLPNGVGFELEDGLIITLCQDCIMELGQLDKESQEKFINDLVEDLKGGRKEL